MRVLFVKDVAGERGWTSIDGSPEDCAQMAGALGAEWRPVTLTQLARYRLTRARFSWLDLVALAVVGTVLQALVR